MEAVTRNAEVVERIKEQVQDEVASRDSGGAESLDREELEKLIRELVSERTRYMKMFSDTDQKAIADAIIDEMLNYGPIQSLLEDPTITEIMVNGRDGVYIERAGIIHRVASGNEMFRDADSIRRLINKILRPLGRRCDEQRPYVDARLPDGSRVNAIIPPVSLNGPCITIRKFATTKLDGSDLVRMGSASVEMMRFLASAVAARCNIIVSGGTGSGKTTLLNALSTYIPESERIITIEDSAELQLAQPHVLRRESRPANAEGSGEITIHNLLVNALRERPDRIIVGECRSTEAIEMLQAMNTGHDGSMTTVHANDPQGAFQRIETMVMESSRLPSMAIRQQIASAIHIVVQVSRFHDGTRKIEEIDAISGIEGGNIVLQPLFRYEVRGHTDEGEIVGEFVPSGFQPTKAVQAMFRTANILLDPDWFMEEGDRQWR